MPVSAAWLRLLLAAVLLAGRLLAPGLPMSEARAAAAGDLASLLGELVICHAGGTSDASEGQAPARPGDHAAACLLCPACHVAGQAALPVADRVIVPYAPVAVIAHAAAAPPATGPPHPARLAARPTGPPALSI